MKLFYIDEQVAKHGDREFTAISAVSIDAAEQSKAYGEFYNRISDVLSLAEEAEGSKTIGRLPIIHGSNLLPNHDDDQKLSAVELLFECFILAGAKFFRLGYYNPELTILKGGRDTRINFCLSSFWMSLKGYNRGPYAFVAEMDSQGLLNGLRYLDDNVLLYHAIGKQSISVDFENFVGHFSAPKSALGCQMADIAGYVALKHENANTSFSRAMAEIYSSHMHYYEVNKIIKLSISS